MPDATQSTTGSYTRTHRHTTTKTRISQENREAYHGHHLSMYITYLFPYVSISSYLEVDVHGVEKDVLVPP